MKQKYLINSFYYLKEFLEKYLSELFYFEFTPPIKQKLPAFKYIPKNFFYLRKLYINGEMQKFKVIHFNRPEAFLSFKKIKNQVSIFHVHGFDVGILGKNYLKDIYNPFKKFFGYLIDKMIENKVKEKIKLTDILYCSTPDLIEPLENWCKRKPIWLPNPIDMEKFKPDGPIIKLEGSPACFLPSRLHGDKKPEIAIDIFKNYIRPKYKDATLHLLEEGELIKRYKRELREKKVYFWHKFMGKDTLAAKIRGADLIFGDFSIGALSLLPLQVMALKKPIVTLDKYEIIKKKIEELPVLALKLLENKEFRDNFIEMNYNYVKNIHSEEKIAKLHLENLQKFL